MQDILVYVVKPELDKRPLIVKEDGHLTQDEIAEHIDEDGFVEAVVEIDLADLLDDESVFEIASDILADRFVGNLPIETLDFEVIGITNPGGLLRVWVKVKVPKEHHPTIR